MLLLVHVMPKLDCFTPLQYSESSPDRFGDKPNSCRVSKLQSTSNRETSTFYKQLGRDYPGSLGLETVQGYRGPFTQEPYQNNPLRAVVYVQEDQALNVGYCRTVAKGQLSISNN